MTEAEESEPEAPKTMSVGEMELETLRREAQEYKDKYLRTLAESENLRKRLQKERQELIQYAIQNIVVDFLNPIDHMEKALSFSENMTGEVKNWVLGFEMILTQFKDALANHGIRPFDSKGHHFDPHYHEAIEMIVTDEFPPGTVIEESVKGYKLGDKPIRPARVKVAKAPIKEELQEIKDKE
jgi:molecular chaperone GrpE